MQKTITTILIKFHSEGMQYPSERDHWNSKIYSKAEVDMRADEMSRLLSAVETNAPGAEENYEKYKQDAATATRESMKVRRSLNHLMSCSLECKLFGFQHIRECNMWCLTIHRDLSRMFQQSRTFIVGRCVQMYLDPKNILSMP